ncbi:plasmid mobilization protein [Clostridium beijerinckii]|uniref:Uncharacterized protein n=1 Tax=Clostridium beijerinckii TaxID=1520 RepID=A0AAE5H7Q3_CLOBE|nr:hypothetical protein [Clostridium beijerinckii]NOW85294.1 hypothetical protein [Clostridium beijerinckii]NSB16440.1 hypothetical protein [Clostridium beijerinckii]OOM19217.1 hypothetical protein CLOBE_54300 [Clostridium beijerinckii]
MTLREIILKLLGREPKKEYQSLRDQRLYIRVTEDEKEIIEKLARCQCLDTSNFVRWLIFGKYIDDFIK